MSKAPSERELQRVERELKRQKPGSQRAVGDGIYMRLDRGGRRRFQFRLRTGSSTQPGGTYDTWQDARQARDSYAPPPPRAKNVADATREEMRAWSIEEYARHAWWPSVLRDCDELTQIDYRRGLNDLLPLVRGLTLAQLIAAPLRVDQLRDDAKTLKTYPQGHKHAGKLAPAAADKVVKTLRMICGHAVDKKILPYNPLAGIAFFNTRRAAADGVAPSHRKVMPSEIKEPRTLALVGVGMRGNPLELARRRLMPELIATGLRPSDILAMRHGWWRDENGPRRYMHIDSAVKDLAGHLLEGEPKTGARDIYLFDAIAERLESICELAGRPDLDDLVFPNRNGGLLDWGNWRTQVWYPALHRAGIATAPDADASGAFWPYVLRHVGIAVMLHAERPEGGTYSEREVARQFGHTVATLDRVYGDIPKNLHGTAGLTMNEILRRARREVWGPMPGDPDHKPAEHDLLAAAKLTGVDNKALAARIQRGSLLGIKRHGKYYVTEFDLVWSGLLPPQASN